MTALDLLIHGSMTSQASRPTRPTTAEWPIPSIRPSGYARWIAELEACTDRDGFATNEGIAAARPAAVPEPD